MMEAIRLCKRYGDVPVLRNFSARFEAGEHYALMGASGVGKTTLLRLLTGLEKPDSGEVRTANGLRLSAVFQEDRLLEHLTAADNALLVSHASRDEVNALLLALGIDEESLPKPVSAFSGGMKRRAALCRALMADYDMLFLDEPYKGLDDATRERVMQVVAERTQGKTVLLITHDAREAAGAKVLEMESAMRNSDSAETGPDRL